MNPNQIAKAMIDANQAYRRGIPYMTDEEYDRLWRNLYAIEPTHPVLYPRADSTARPGEITHIRPILDTQRAFNMEELKPFLLRFKSAELIVEPKYDGVHVVRYRHTTGDFHYILGGNGHSGRDVTHILPDDQYPLDQGQGPAEKHFEAIIMNVHWLDRLGKNPRNVVAGYLNSKEYKNEMAAITLIPHENYKAEILLTNMIPGLEETLLSLYNQWSQDYPLDGLMIKVSDPELRLAASHDKTYKWSIAWKPPIQTAETTVTDIEWNVSRAGRVIPTVVYEPVELCGTTNTRATGNNGRWIEERELGIGSIIILGKAGEIIPKILKVKKRILSQLPVNCPICNTILVWDNPQLMCYGEDCLPQLAKSLEYFYSDKGMDIRGIGTARIYELLNNPELYTVLKRAPWALLAPTRWMKLMIAETWGQKHTDNYLTELTKMSGRKDTAHLIAAMGYKGLAYKTTLELLQTMKGYRTGGKVKAAGMKHFIEAIADLTKALPDIVGFKLAPLPRPATTTYCITGELSQHRDEITAYLTTYGWQERNQVSSKTDYLILGHNKHKTTKHHKAEHFNTPIITEEELPALLIKKG